MHVISKKRIWDAMKMFPHSASALNGWYTVISKNKFEHYTNLKSTFGSVDKVGFLYVFNIGGNKLRLIASIHFNRQKVYVRDVLTHAEYNLGMWKNRRAIR